MATNPRPLFEPLYTWHVALVTRHIDECVARLWDDFGLGPWQFVKFEFAQGDARVFGKSTTLGVQAAITQVGFLTLGFDQPLNAPDPYSEMIDARGGGAHHIAFAIADEELARRQMRALGHRELLAVDGIGPSREGQAGYFDTRDELGTYIELSKVPAELPALGRVFPDAAAVRRGSITVRSTSHIAIVVRDLEATIGNFERMLGIGPWIIETVSGPARFRGAALNYSARTATTTAGSYVLVLEQPISPGGPLNEFLDRHGQGIHRIAFVVDSLAGVASELERRGYAELFSLASHSDPKRPTAIVVDSERLVGVTIELRDGPVTGS